MKTRNLRWRVMWAVGAAAAGSLLLLPTTAQAAPQPAPQHAAQAVTVVGRMVIAGRTYGVINVPGATPSPDRASAVLAAAAIPSTIVNRHSEKCAEVYRSQTGNGANVDQWTCNGTRTQTWRFELAYADTYGNPVGIIKNANSGKCFEVYQWRAANGSNVDQWNCAPIDQLHSNQLWDLDGPFLVAVGASVERNLQVVAEVNGWSTSNKGNVDIWQNYADANQMWNSNFGG